MFVLEDVTYFLTDIVLIWFNNMPVVTTNRFKPLVGQRIGFEQ